MDNQGYIEAIAKEAARQAIAEDRSNRKLGRDDRGSGSAVIGQILLKNRTDTGMSQRELAKNAGLHPTTIGKIETGERGMSLETFCKLANWLEEEFVWDIVEELAPLPNG